MIVAAAQTIPMDGNIEANVADHCRWGELAADSGAQLVVFPEMSLTGYQRASAKELSFVIEDPRLEELKAVSVNRKIIIVAGAPLRIGPELHIGSFIFLPDGTESVYTKQFLHEGEEAFFSANFDYNPLLRLADERISLAICADISRPEHAANAGRSGATLYVASLFYTPAGINEGHRNLAGYANKHAINVLMSNYGGPSGGLESGGKSAFWSSSGERVAHLKEGMEGLLIVGKEGGKWMAYNTG